jgi:putative membrane protein
MIRAVDIARLGVMTAAATFMAAACGKGNENGGSGATTQAATAGASTGASAGASSATASADTSRNRSSSAGEVSASSDISQMSDSNIVAKLDASDKGEVELARLMETKATNDSVKAYAKKLVSDHTKSEKDVMNLERQAKLGASPLKSDTTRQGAQHELQALRTMRKGKALDSAFVQHEVEDHQHDIADAKAMQNQAKNDQLKNLIGQTIPVLQQHLDIAQRLSQQLASGATSDSGKTAR